MAITSFGYAGTVGAGQWVTLQRTIGTRYSVVGQSDLALGVTTTGVTIGAGSAGGGGVHDVLASAEPLVLTKPSGSTRQWWMIVLRRNWNTLATTLAAIPAGTGSAEPAVLPTRNMSMGDIDDQPLWMVSWLGTSSTPTLATAVDLRLIGRGPSNFVANDFRVGQYFREPGALLRVGSTDWMCVIGAGGVLEWVQVGTGSGSGSNANGEYRKLADGTLFCWTTRIFPGNNGNTRDYLWPYPQAFASTPMVFVTPQSSAPQVHSVSASAVGLTSANIHHRRTTDEDTRLNFAAMGRWQ